MSCCGTSKSEDKGTAEEKKRTNNNCLPCLVSCCIFWFVLCAILVTVLWFVGRHLLFNRAPYEYHSTPKSVANTSTLAERSYLRLARDVRPSLYNLTLLPYLDKDYFEGFVEISLEVQNPKTEIFLHSQVQTIYSVELSRDENRKKLDILGVTDNVKGQVLIITPKQKIFPGNYSLAIKFAGALEKKLGGLYKSTYRIGGEWRTIATSKFEPTYARQAFPCFDEPNKKAQYIVHLLKPKAGNYIALSNYPVAKIESFDESNDLVTFEKTVSMSTYLTCFIVSDFTYTSTKFNNSGKETELRVYASPGNLEKTTYAGEVAKKAIEFYVNYFGIPYPLPKLDLVAIPDFVSGAMEHWGLVTFRETALLYTNKTHSEANKQRVAEVIAHELAHSWFGNLVTIDWWNDLWLNEGFASYIEYKGVDAAEPSWQMMTQFQASDLHRVLSLDATLSSHPIVQTVTTPDEITSIFDAISYSKGASILRMLEDAVGEENFRSAVTRYLKKYEFGNAVTKNLLDEIQAVVGSKLNVAEMMDTFTVQMGYPILNASYDSATRTYTLTQKRFLKDPTVSYDASSTVYGYKWTIPVTYVTDLGKSKDSIIFPHNQESIMVQKLENASWLKFNYDQVGYYRVNYVESEWKNLINIYSKLATTDRTHLLEETFGIAEAGQISYTIPLDLSRQLMNEIDYAPWNVASAKLKSISTYLKESDQNEPFKDYVKLVVSNAVSEFTWNEAEDDSHLRRLARVTVLALACSVDQEDCLAQAEEKFNAWINDTSQPLSQDLRGIVYKYGMVNATEETWNQLLEVYKAESDASEKLKLINGLANVKNATLLARLLELAKNENIVRGQDYFTVLGLISNNPEGTDLVWNFVRENWEYLVNRFTLNDRYLGSLMTSITNTFSTEQRLKEMEEFFAKYPDAGAGTSSRKIALETVKNNINWLKNYKSTVEAWINGLKEN